MNTPQQQTSGFKITPGDVVYTIFRHLKKIIFFAIVGLICGAAVYKYWPLYYESSATLMIRFISEDRGDPLDQQERTITPGGRGASHIISAERKIIESLDLASVVAEKIGPERLVTEKQEPSLAAATGMIKSGISTYTPRYSNLISISFQHPNREVISDTLEQVIETYLDLHLKIHRKSEAFENFVTRETDQMRARLQQTEEEIRATKARANIVSIAAAKSGISDEAKQLRASLLDTQTSLAELAMTITRQEETLERHSSAASTSDADENQTQQSDEYYDLIRRQRALVEKINLLRDRVKTIELKYTAESNVVQNIRKQIRETEEQLVALREENPDLNTTSTTIIDEGVDTAQLLASELNQNRIRRANLQARFSVLSEQLEALMKEASRIEEVELTINELSRKRDLQETKYRSLLESMEQSRIREEIGEGRINNISIIQSPSPAYLAQNERVKFAGGTAAGIAVIGLVWAFLVDLLLDQSIKRPTEIQRNLGIPLFMSLPDLSDKRYRKINKKANRHALQQAAKIKQLNSSKKKDAYKPKSATLQAAALSKPEDYGNGDNAGSREIAPWDDQHALNGHFDALRDKVITYFESKNLTHKPKLIAMTGLGQESGVTTIASGLAGSLSKIGEGNVLLVDMTLGQETAQQFYNGKNILNLDEVLESENEGNAKVESNLYVVAEGTNGTKLPRIMPQRFNKIMPKLRASDFDYIIFDMPPVSPISSTPRLASFMDVVLMVMESEETDRGAANQALELLADSKAHLGGILNKTKSRVPKKLENDLMSQA